MWLLSGFAAGAGFLVLVSRILRRPRWVASGERGSALLLVLLVSIILAFFGMAVLLQTSLGLEAAGADRWVVKSLAAAEGQEVGPDALYDRSIPASKRDELVQARKKLTTAISAGGRTRAPEDSAMAQTSFDCWIQEQEENHGRCETQNQHTEADCQEDNSKIQEREELLLS